MDLQTRRRISKIKIYKHLSKAKSLCDFWDWELQAFVNNFEEILEKEHKKK